uniref:Uncharacterized protein n=1 Tax=Rhizophora mucronata TaxID=61149 RepID=A0A2P2PSB0_RHIMU
MCLSSALTGTESHFCPVMGSEQDLAFPQVDCFLAFLSLMESR